MSGTWEVISQSKTSTTQYVIAKALLDLSTTADALLTSITQNINLTTGGGPVAISQSSTTGTGSGAVFQLTGVVSSTNAITGVTVSVIGSGYQPGDIITFTKDAINATAFAGATRDLIITLNQDDFVDGALTGAQLNPGDFPNNNATTSGFDTDGYGHGTTIMFNIATNPGTIRVALDGNNTNPLLYNTWKELVLYPPLSETAITTTGGFFLATKDSYNYIRLRVSSKSAGALNIENIRIMSNS